MKIRAYLALMVAAILIPVIVFATLSMNMLREAEREAALRGVREVARSTMVSIDRELSNTEATLRMLGTSQLLALNNLPAFYRRARFADAAEGSWTALTDDHGRQLLNTAVPFGAPLPEGAAGTRALPALDAGETRVSDLLESVGQIVTDVPITTELGQRFVLSHGVAIDHLKKVLKEGSAPASWVVTVFDRNGNTIVQSRPDPSREHLRGAVLRRAVGLVPDSDAKGQVMYTVLERSGVSGWTVAVAVPEADIDATAREAGMIASLGLMACLGCAALAALFFARRLTLAIRAAADSAHALERGAAPAPVRPSGVLEMDEVQAAVVAAATVVEQERESRKLAEMERETSLANERAARNVAEQQNRAKDEFLAMLGHELRNPLSAIMNASGLIGMRGQASDSTARAQEIISRQGKHLVRIVDDLLDAGRVHSGKILLERHPMRLDTMVEAHIAQLRQAGRLRGHSVECTTEAAWVNADPTRIEQVTANLLDNALKYTPMGGRITVGVRVEGKEAVLTVADNGVGIAPELIPYVFDLFVQGARALDRAQGGLGVGLALVKRLAEMHGGHVSVRSAGTAQGSVFEVRLPLGAAPAPVAVAQQTEHAAPSRQRILLIEDNRDGREALTLMLHAEGYEVAAAADGSEGLRLAQSSRPSVALVDIGLPGIDGYEVARRMRADPQLQAVRLIALTGYGQAGDQQRSLDAGFDAHLVKPVHLRRLVDAIEETS